VIDPLYRRRSRGTPYYVRDGGLSGRAAAIRNELRLILRGTRDANRLTKTAI
jgi:hypothetical protein